MRILCVAWCLSLMLIACGVRPADAECGPYPSCTLLKDYDVVFTGTLLDTEPYLYRFRLLEKLKGVKGSTITVDLMPSEEGSPGFVVGQQYLVFASRMAFDDESRIVTDPCKPSRHLAVANPMLEQLRREKNGRRPAAVYGWLRRAMNPLFESADSIGAINVSGVVISLRSDQETVQTKTDKEGTFRFDGISPGTYRVSADLPASLETAQTILLKPFPPLEIER